jgi:hypothetical protein
MTSLIAAALALVLGLGAALGAPMVASAQTGAQAPTAPGAPGPAGPGAPGQPGPLGQPPEEAARPTATLLGAEIFDFIGFGFGDIAALPPGYYVLPSFTLSETYDDNVFLTSSDKRDDFITRFTPGIRLGYVSTPLTLLAGYALDAEVYAKDSDLNNVGDRQRGDLDFRYLPNPLLLLAVNGTYARSNDPVDINRQGALLRRQGVAPSGVPVTETSGRTETTVFTLSPRVNYQFTPLWSGDAAYTFAFTDTEDSSSSTSHTISLGASRVLTDKDTGTLGYSFSIFDTDEDSTTSHAVIVGWTRRVSEFLTVGLLAGPRFNEDGDVNADAGLTVSYRLGRLTDASLIYSRSQGLVTDREGSSTIDAVSAVVRTRLRQFLSVSAGPTYTRISDSSNGTNGTTSLYGLDASASYQLTRRLSAGLTYRFSYEEGSGGEIFHNTVTLGLTISQAIRVY